MVNEIKLTCEEIETENKISWFLKKNKQSKKFLIEFAG